MLYAAAVPLARQRLRLHGAHGIRVEQRAIRLLLVKAGRQAWSALEVAVQESISWWTQKKEEERRAKEEERRKREERKRQKEEARKKHKKDAAE